MALLVLSISFADVPKWKASAGAVSGYLSASVRNINTKIVSSNINIVIASSISNNNSNMISSIKLDIIGIISIGSIKTNSSTADVPKWKASAGRSVDISLQTCVMLKVL